MLNHLATVGPLAVNVDASNWSSYTGGVFDGCDFAANMDLNHVVQLVGYTEVGPSEACPPSWPGCLDRS